ncbi:MAG: tetratricopeptide repeat protein [Symploca sp. SIO2G7]|nr:tetratricopeptide repeat protein [Symploca sp. SIO2G7]
MNPAYIDRLLQALKDQDESVRNQATGEFWHMWFHQKGIQGAKRLIESQTLVEAERNKEARTILDELILTQPDFAEAWNRRAVLNYVQGDYFDAINDCEKVLKLVPHHFGALHGLGLCHASVGNYRDAIQYFRRTLDIQPFSMINQRLILECITKLN